MAKPILSDDFWNSPEFQAVAKKLGIDTNLCTEDLTIYIRRGDIVRVDQEFYATQQKGNPPHPDKLL